MSSFPVEVDHALIEELIHRNLIPNAIKIDGFHQLSKKLNTENVSAQFKRRFGIPHFHVRVIGPLADGRQEFAEIRINAESRSKQPSLRVMHEFLYDDERNELIIKPRLYLDHTSFADIGGYTTLMDRHEFWKKGVIEALGFQSLHIADLDGDPIVVTPIMPHEITYKLIATTASRRDKEAERYYRSVFPYREVFPQQGIAIGANGTETDPSNTEQSLCETLTGNSA